jgi:hypothetical protein
MNKTPELPYNLYIFSMTSFWATFPDKPGDRDRVWCREGSDMTFITRGSSLLGLLFILHCCVSIVLAREDNASQAAGDIASTGSGSAQTREPASEADFREEVQRVEQLAQGIAGGLKTYHEHLQTAMQKKGFGPYHPLFRTHINGFLIDQIDLEDSDEYKRGSFALSLKTAGQPLDPDPFGDWLAVQKSLDGFEATMDNARMVMARADLFVANGKANIPRDIFQQLRKRWRAAAGQAMDAYDHATAIRAVFYIDGKTVHAPQSYRFIRGGVRYGVMCAFGVCSPQSAEANDEH